MSSNLVVSDGEVLMRLTKAAKVQGVSLTYAHKMFFLRLLAYARDKGTSVDDGLAVRLSVQELSALLCVPLRTTIQSLSRLTACGALRRTEEKKTFPRSPSLTVVCNFIFLKE